MAVELGKCPLCDLIEYAKRTDDVEGALVVALKASTDILLFASDTCERHLRGFAELSRRADEKLHVMCFHPEEAPPQS